LADFVAKVSRERSKAGQALKEAFYCRLLPWERRLTNATAT